MAAFVSAIRIDPNRVADNIRRSCITITELADSLVRSESLSFRQAHEIAATVARAVVSSGGGLETDGYGPFVKAFEQHVGRPTTVTAEMFRTFVSPEYFVSVRTRFGGPAPEPLTEALDLYAEKASALRAAAERTAQHEAAAVAELARRFARLKEMA